MFCLVVKLSNFNFVFLYCSWNSASILRDWIESQRESLEWSRKEWLYCFARQRGLQWASVLKTVYPNPGEDQGACRACIPAIQGSSLRWASIVLNRTTWRVLQVVNIFYLEGVLILQKSPKILLCICLEGEPGPSPKAALSFLDCSSLVLWRRKPFFGQSDQRLPCSSQ